MTGPITFADYRARSHLLIRGFVYSFRSRERTTGETWARWSRGGEGKLDVAVSRERDVHEPEDLDPFAPCSGFRNRAAWEIAIEEHHGDLSGGSVYRVDLLGFR